jgi:quinol monooxygenase YgiN
MPELQAIARYIITAGNEERVLALLEELAAASRAEPGNIAFDPYVSPTDPRKIALLERYTSREAFEEHRATEHFQRIVLDQLVHLLDERTVEQLDA